MRRRNFITAASAFAAIFPQAKAAPSADKKFHSNVLLKVGIVSDTHVNDRSQKEKLAMLEKVLRLFDKEKVDAVMMPGDIGHGTVLSLEILAELYFKVFPGDKGSDGRHVERLFVTGNHDVDEWLYCKKKNESIEELAERTRGNFFHFHRQETWQRLFKEPYETCFVKDVKGFKFVLRHWPSSQLQEDHALEPVLKKYGKKLAKERVFFFCEHEQPSATVNTNYRLIAEGEWYSNAETKGGAITRKLLNDYPNCIALTGHSHCPLADERSIWQGEFTAVNCGHMSGWAFAAPGRENGHDHEGSKSPVREMKPFNFRDVHDAVIMTVTKDEAIFRRLDVQRDALLGDDWVVPLDAALRPYAFASRSNASKPPVFAAKSKVVVREIEDGEDRAGNRHAQVEVSFPPVTSASGGERAHDYSVRMEMMIGDIVRIIDEKRVYSEHFAHGEEFEKEPVRCLFARSSIPPQRKIRFVVTPYNCWLKPGASIASAYQRFK